MKCPERLQHIVINWNVLQRFLGVRMYGEKNAHTGDEDWHDLNG